MTTINRTYYEEDDLIVLEVECDFCKKTDSIDFSKSCMIDGIVDFIDSGWKVKICDDVATHICPSCFERLKAAEKEEGNELQEEDPTANRD